MTGSIGELLFAAVVFVGAHLLLSSPPVRNAVTLRIGQWPFLGLYSLIAAGSLFWFVWAYVNAPYIEIWPQTRWARLLPLIIMPFSMILLVCGFSMSNPAAVGQGRLLAAHDQVSGILKVTRHPVMWGIALWAGSHVPVNGDVASLILFGGLLFLALGGAAHIDSRRRTIKDPDWRRFLQATSYLPFAAIIAGRIHFAFRDIGGTRLLVALGAFVAFLLVHGWIIGVSAWPG